MCFVQYGNENIENNDVENSAIVRVSKCRYFHVFTWAVDNRISPSRNADCSYWTRCERCSRAALICLLRLTADVSWLQCNFAPALCSEMKVFSWAVYAGLFVYIHSSGRWMFTLSLFLEPTLRLLHLFPCVYYFLSWVFFSGRGGAFEACSYCFFCRSK